MGGGSAGGGSQTGGGAAVGGGSADAGAPRTTLSPATNDFGSLVIGAVSPAVDFTVVNDGGSAAPDPHVSLGGGDADQFQIVSDGCSGGPLPPAQPCTVSVSFAPTRVGPRTASLHVAGAGSDAILSGVGLSPAALAFSDGDAGNFGLVPVGDAGTATVTLLNAGNAASGLLGAPLITGANAADWTVDSDGCTGRSLAPPDAGSCALQLRFAPSDAGARSASLAVSASPGGTATLPLIGTGGRSVLSVTPASFNFGTLCSPSTPTVDVPFTVTNTGNLVSGVPTVSLSTTHWQLGMNGCTGPLAAGASCQVMVRGVEDAVTPLGTFDATLITSAPGAVPGQAALHELWLNSADPIPDAMSHSFGVVARGSSGTAFTFNFQSFFMYTTQPLIAAMDGDGASQFTITSDTCTGTSLSFTQTCRVTVNFTPVTAAPAGFAYAALRVYWSTLATSNCGGATLSGVAQ
jgi:hypothetical protein